MMTENALISSKFQGFGPLKSVTKACLSFQNSEEVTGQIVNWWQINVTKLCKKIWQAEIAPCFWLEIPHLKVVDLFNLKPKLEQEKPTVQQERIRAKCNNLKALNHLNLLMVDKMNLLDNRTTLLNHNSKFIREHREIKLHQHRM